MLSGVQLEDQSESLSQKQKSQQTLKASKPQAYTEILKEPVIAQSKDSLIEKLFRVFESMSFSPLNIGWGASSSELEIFYYGSHFSHVRYLDELHNEPQASDLLIIHGELNRKFDSELLELYSKMQKPCYVIQFGPKGIMQDYCRSKALGREVPIDLCIPGNPVSPDEILSSLELLKKKIKG
jgi:NADH:ubiquinone oxidoreductase subunit B-like Fe-S oxidoreductase